MKSSLDSISANASTISRHCFEQRGVRAGFAPRRAHVPGVGHTPQARKRLALSLFNKLLTLCRLHPPRACVRTHGRRVAIGCVAREITQRCNLDCSYCHLSEYSEALRDIPIEEVFRRIDLIVARHEAVHGAKPRAHFLGRSRPSWANRTTIRTPIDPFSNALP
jgi:sulfatase maturation enzyme AslB (radical SAM superfamily)